MQKNPRDSWRIKGHVEEEFWSETKEWKVNLRAIDGEFKMCGEFQTHQIDFELATFKLEIQGIFEASPYEKSLCVFPPSLMILSSKSLKLRTEMTDA